MVSNKAKIFGIIVVFLMISSIAIAQEYQVEHSALARGGIAVLRVRVSGPAKDLKVILSGPEGNTVGKASIAKDNLLDGVESVDVEMGEWRETPKPGVYTLLVFDYADRIYYKENLTFKGGDLSITKAEIEFEGGFTINLRLTVLNKGDLPVFTDYCEVKIDDECYVSRDYLGFSPEKSEASCHIHHVFVEEGVHSVAIKLYSKGEETATYTKTIRV
jgi:hypothetical protein